jgi:DNA repair photolyase
MQNRKSLIKTTFQKDSVCWYVDQMVQRGEWKPVSLPPELVGLGCPITVFEAKRESNFITRLKMKPENRATTYCPCNLWRDLRIGSGACGLQCRRCFLVLTHRIKRDPRRHVIYVNHEDYQREVDNWLKDPSKGMNLGLGIDCSDSLLYDNYTKITQWLIPMFGDQKTGRPKKLILLTKSTNVDQILDLHHNGNVAVTFSSYPPEIANVWETLAPPVYDRVKASIKVQDAGYHTGWRLDPILGIEGFEKFYEGFLETSRDMGARPERVTLGTYREFRLLKLWCEEKWRLPKLEYNPEMEKDGDRFREVDRIKILTSVISLIKRIMPWVKIDLCKETHVIRDALGFGKREPMCNCIWGRERNQK